MSNQERFQLNNLIQKSGIKKTQLAASVGISRSVLYLFLKGEYSLPAETLIRLKQRVYGTARVMQNVV